MDLKIITGFLLCLCFLAHTSISQAAPNHSALSKLARRQAEDETAGDTTANADEDAAAATTAQPESDNSDKPTVILADGTTLVIPEGSTATIVADNEVTTVAADDNTVTASATGEADAASTGAADASEGAATGADEATTAAGEAATGADEATTAAGEASTGVDAASTDGATDGDAATDATESATGEATEATDAAEATSDATDGTANPSAATDADSSDATGATTSAGDTTEQGASEGTAATVTDDGATTDDVSGATVEQGTTDAAATTEDDGQTGTATTDGAGTDDGVTEPGVTQGPVAPGPGPSPGTAELRVVINPDRIQAQSGRTADLTCVVYGGDASTSIYWIQDEPERRYALTDPASGDDRQINGDQITLRARITLDDRSKFGKYTCMAQGASGNSAAATLDLQESSGYYPGPQPGPQPGQQPAPGPGGNRGYLRIVAPDMVDGEFVEIQCEGAAPEDESSIQWFFNGRLVTDQDPLYPRGKTLYIRPISRAYLGNYRCSVPGSGYTEGNSVLTFGGVPAPTPPPSDGGYVQPTQPISGRCGIDEATCRNGRCIPRSYLCNGNDDCGDGSDESCGPAGGSGSDACQPNEIQCSNPGRGRKCVQKFWMCDGDRDCDDGSDEEQRYCELLPRQRYCKTSEFQCAGYNGTNASPVCVPRSFQCDGYNDCPDRSDEIGCVKPTVISPPQRQIQINAGQTLTIQCTARGSPAPYINWRLNWGHICRDGYDNGRCQISQSIDASDPSLVTGTLTIRNVNNNDAGAYSCEALNNQGFIFAIPDAIVNVIIGQPQPSVSCNCNGHSSTCTPDGRCLNCQHNTAGAYCEYCASGFQGDARRGTPDACQPIPVIPTAQYCNPAGTYTERGGRCICKYNVEGDRCDQCKRNHFYLNPSSANGCLQCFCSGVSNDCTSSDWRRKSVSLPLNNWNVVPKNFATDRYEGRDAIQRRNGGRELAIDQSSLGRPANDVLYWKAPREALGDLVTLYDGSIEVHFTNDGNENDAPSNDEFIWLRGNNIDLVHKLPQTQRFKANADATYSVACNERSFTRKDGTYIDRENILMALADVDTFLVKVNPIGGRRTAVLRGVTLHPAARDGNGDTALTVEACRCPANYTGSSCEKCAEGYGRPHPLVGIYLGQCWSCRSLCNERSDRCDRDTGKCSDCQDNSDGDRCERCRAGYTLDPRLNRCVPDGGYAPGSDPTQPPYGPGPRGTYYINSQSFDGRGGSPTNIILDGNQPEQRIPVQLLGVQPRSVVWGRTDGTQLPGGVSQEGYDLVIRNPSAEQAGHYICTITHPDGHIERIPVHLEYRPGQVRPSGPNFGYAPFNSPSPNSVQPGATQLIEPQGNYNRVEWTRADGQPFPAGVYQTGNGLYINGARPEHSATYYCVLYDANGNPTTVPYEVRVEGSPYGQVAGTAPTVRIQPSVITLKEGQRMFVEYTVNSNDPDIQVVWSQVTPDGLRPIPSLFTVEQNRLFLARATSDIAGTYRVVVSNAYGRDSQDLTINVTPRRIRGQGRGQAGAPQVRFAQENYEVASGQSINIVPSVYGGSGATYTWSKDGSTNLPEGVFASGDGSLRIDGRSDQIGGRYYLDVSNAYGRVQSSPITVRWAGSYGQSGNYDADQDRSRSYVAVQFAARDEQSHQTGQDIQLQCSVQGNVDRPYEYTYTKDGRPLENNVEVHPNGLLIVRNAQAQDSGRYRCEVTFPRAPELGAQENSYDLRVDDGSAGGHGGQDGHDHHQGGYVEASADPAELTVSRGESKTISCQVKGAQSSTVKWGKYAHETTLPSYMRQQGNNVIIAPTDDTPSEQMYLQCQVDVPGQTQPVHAYASVTIRGGDESSKKKKKRRS